MLGQSFPYSRLVAQPANGAVMRGGESGVALTMSILAGQPNKNRPQETAQNIFHFRYERCLQAPALSAMESHLPSQRQQLIISGVFGLHSFLAAWLATIPLLETVRLTYYLMELDPPENIRPPPKDFQEHRMYRLVRWGVFAVNEFRAWTRTVLPHWRLITALGIYFGTETTGFMYHSGIPAFDNQLARGAEFGLFYWILQRISDGVVTGFEELIPYPRKWPLRRRHFANAISYTMWGAFMGYLWSVPLLGWRRVRI